MKVVAGLITNNRTTSIHTMDTHSIGLLKTTILTRISD